MEQREITGQEFASVNQSKTEDVSTDDEYSFRKCFTEEDVATCTDWRPNQYIPSNKRLPNDSRTLDYYCMNKRPFIQTETNTSSSYGSSIKFEDSDNKILLKNELVKYSSELYTEFEHEEDSDVTIEKLEPPELSIENSSSSETKTDSKPNIMTLQHWLQLPADEYSLYCANLPKHSQLDKNLSEDDDSDPQNSDISNQFSIQQTYSSQTTNEPGIHSLQDTLRIHVDKDPRVYCKSRVKCSTDSPEGRPTGVKKWKETTHRNRLKSRVLTKSTNNSGHRRSRSTRERLKVENKDPHHNDRRITRSLIKSIENTSPINNARNPIGKFVWGYCMGWWPAIIVNAEDGGLESKPEKVCVYWIGEDLISLLNEKTQVEPFSTNLDVRLLRYLKDDAGTKGRRKASFVTLKLFSKYLNIPLLKPYITWAEKHLVAKSHLNQLKFHPFPKNMQQRLDQLKQQNIKAREKIARDEARAKRLSKQSCSMDNEEVCNNLDEKLPDINEEQHILPLMDQKPGVIVWGKITGHSWWPAMIIYNHDCGKKEPNFGCQWILWYGDYQLSQVHYQNVMKFDEGMKKMHSYIMQCRREKYMKAVLSACKDHCTRLNYDTGNWTMDDVLSWVSSLDSALKMCPIPRPNDGRLESRYSSHIAEKLREIKSNQEVGVERENRIENCDALKAVFAGLPNTLEVLCIICLKICYEALQDHPFFECAICNSCVEDLKATVFAYGDDGKCFYCTLCAGSDTVVMCDSFDCSRVYCTACLKYLICPTEYNEILIKDPWLCFLCDNDQGAKKNRLFKPRSDWKTRIGQLFHTNQEISWNDAWNNDGKTRNMRVLSLFDGISTGLLVLEKLGIVVEDYYASEIDVDAQLVSAAYFGDRVYRLGDVRNVTKDIIDAIAPIDLLIGGSPCNDLSLVNPNRLGLHDPKGTGVLFFDYCRIKELLIEANEGRHLFWLFENVASMPSRYRLAINESLQCEPSLIDAADFSPQHRPRLFWGNLPSGVNFPPADPSQDLQSVLTPNCNRHALVKKIRTVTTKVNSLKQGISLLKPVLMNGEADSLWITELEEIFGFPKHYTDVKNLSATKRQKLIGQAWSVQTITALLLPLRYFFNTRDNSPAACNQ